MGSWLTTLLAITGGIAWFAAIVYGLLWVGSLAVWSVTRRKADGHRTYVWQQLEILRYRWKYLRQGGSPTDAQREEITKNLDYTERFPESSKGARMPLVVKYLERYRIPRQEQGGEG